MAVIETFAERIPPVLHTELGGAVYDRLQAEPERQVLAVVDDDHRPIGLIDRSAFGLRMAAAYGRALYAGRPVSLLMNPNPTVVSAHAPMESFIGPMLERNAGALLEGFIVTGRGGRYVGVGTAISVLRAGYAHSQAQAEEMRRMMEGLARAEAEARASARARSQFLAVMSHEVRTPLNGVLTVAEMLQARLVQPELQPYVRTIVTSGETLLRLLNDALDLSRVEAGSGLNLVKAPFELAPLLRDVEVLWSSRAEQTGVRFAIDCNLEEGVWLDGDAVRLKQVFNNLIGNALKFTTEGQVVVSAHLELSPEGQRLVGVVSDTGPGIPLEKQASIFVPFSPDSDTVAGGAGLGLSICRELVEAMGGRISVESALGKGATFRFDALLDRAAPPASAAPEGQAAAPDEPLHVLVVDDNETNRLVAAMLLDAAGCSYEMAEDGFVAVEKVQSRPFDLVLMDVKMPRLDGLEATRLIRGGEGSRRDIPIIALTANADREDARRYLSAGMDAVVRKPIKAEELYAAMSEALKPPLSQEARDAA
jgi:signal transduction histidine kinase/ActR/RegA family two-component response regulator